MNTYKEKQQEKLERYQELAEKAKEKSEDHYETAHRIADVIPLGQPILVGHHSEKRHRRDLDRIHNNHRKSIEEAEKAKYYKNKAQNIINPKQISSDDPEAIQKLQEKLKEMEKERENIKKENKEARKLKEKPLHPSFVLRNLSANIRRVKERIEYLTELDSIEQEETTLNNITLVINKELNRVQLFFPGKPSLQTRNNLKANGFRWSPRNRAWQRMISDYAISAATEIQRNCEEFVKEAIEYFRLHFR